MRGYGTFPVAAKAAGEAPPPPPPSLWSRVMLKGVEPAMRAGAARQLTSADLRALPTAAAADAQAALARLEPLARRVGGSLARALALAHGAGVLRCGAAMALCAALDVAAPALLRVAVDALAAPAALEARALAQWVALFVAARAVAAVARAHLRLALAAEGVRAGAALRLLLFRKALRRHAFLARGGDEPELATLLSTDVPRVLAALRAANSLWILPLEIGAMVALLFALLGVAALAGLAAVAASVAAGALVARAAGRAMRELLQRQDRRMEAVREVFGAMRAVKVDASEEAAARAIGALRGRELAAARRFLWLRALSSFVLWASPLLVSTVTLAVYALARGRAPSAAAVFAALALFAALRDPLRELPSVLQALVQARVSLRRVERFLRLPEVGDDGDNGDGRDKRVLSSGDSEALPPGVAVRVVGGAFGFGGDAAAAVLRGVDIEIREGDLAVVHGPVGAGKSALCLALLGELPRLGGSAVLRRSPGGAAAFVAQQPWVQHLTLRDNILMGRALDPRRYARVLDACALRPDLAALPAGDLTEVAPGGANLSGGQRARLALARACYAVADADADAAVVVLDAPLAPLDAAVQREVFAKCVAGGLLARSTVVLATHNRDVLAADVVDCRIEVAGGRVVCSRAEPTAAQARRRALGSDACGGGEAAAVGAEAEAEAETERRDRGRLVQAEARPAGRVAASVFRAYVDAVGGGVAAAGVLLLLLLWQVCQVSSDLWLSRWTSAEASPGAGSARRAVLVYAALTASCAALVLARAAAVAFAGLRGSSRLFERMTRALLAARLRFWDATPVGRVLARYGEDAATLDLSLAPTLGGCLVNAFMAGAQLATAAAIVRGAAVLVAPLACVYARVAGFYLASSREIGRLRRAAAAPVLSHAAQSAAGAVELRALGRAALAAAERDHAARVDEGSRALLADAAVRQWFQLRVELVGAAVALVVGAGVLLLRRSIPPGLAGLAFLYALHVDVGLSALVRVWADAELQMLSAERVLEYARVPPEEADAPRAPVADAEWPAACAVRFQDVVFRYSPGGAPVLHGVSFAVAAGEHVGVVGRTGAGKSSLVMALLRVSELSAGVVSIGGRDAASFPLRTLRSRVSVIAQAPVLFRGPLRRYLDPRGAAADADVWAALAAVGIKQRVARLPLRLQHEVAAHGDNLSVGERQLLSLARALLAGSRLVVLDEATAAVDRDSERRLQRSVARELRARGATVLTIAHRLATVLRADRVLVLRGGRVAEFDAPQTLLEDPRSVLAGLARDAALLAAADAL